MKAPLLYGLAAGAGSFIFELETSPERAAAFGITFGLLDPQLDGTVDSRLLQIFLTTIGTTLICNMSNPHRKLTMLKVIQLGIAAAAVTLPFAVANATYANSKKSFLSYFEG